MLAVVLLFTVTSCKDGAEDSLTLVEKLDGNTYKITKGDASVIPENGYLLISIDTGGIVIESYANATDTNPSNIVIIKSEDVTSTQTIISFNYNSSKMNLNNNFNMTMTNGSSTTNCTTAKQDEKSFPSWLLNKKFQGHTSACGFRIQFGETYSKYRLYSNYTPDEWTDLKGSWNTRLSSSSLTIDSSTKVTIKYVDSISVVLENRNGEVWLSAHETPATGIKMEQTIVSFD